MGDMLSIGEIAHSTGMSRRQLRHWEAIGLLEPDSVDEVTGYRRYAPSQSGRVRAIAALRALGFSLTAIAGLLDSQVGEPRLVQLLRERETELVLQVEDASTALRQVRTRLAALEKGTHLIMDTLQLRPLPALRLIGLRASVRDESEIPDAVSDLLPRFQALVGQLPSPDADLVLLYDGTSDAEIIVSVGTPAPELADGRDALAAVAVDAAELGASVTFDTGPANIGDAWIALDAQLEDRGHRTTGVHRHVVGHDGRVSLQAPIQSLG